MTHLKCVTQIEYCKMFVFNLLQFRLKIKFFRFVKLIERGNISTCGETQF